MSWKDRARDVLTVVVIGGAAFGLYVVAAKSAIEQEKERKKRYARYAKLAWEKVDEDLYTVKTAEGVIVSISRGSSKMWRVEAFRGDVRVRSKNRYPKLEMAKARVPKIAETVLYPPSSDEKKDYKVAKAGDPE